MRSKSAFHYILKIIGPLWTYTLFNRLISWFNLSVSSHRMDAHCFRQNFSTPVRPPTKINNSLRWHNQQPPSAAAQNLHSNTKPSWRVGLPEVPGWQQWTLQSECAKLKLAVCRVCGNMDGSRTVQMVFVIIHSAGTCSVCLSTARTQAAIHQRCYQTAAGGHRGEICGNHLWSGPWASCV